MPEFIVHVALYNGPDLVRFAPGDKLPVWAKDKVGAHCLNSKGPVVEAAEEAPEEAEVAEEVEEESEAEEETEAAEEAPDFTKPAPRRGRPRAKKD